MKHSAFVDAQKRVHQDEALGNDYASAHSLVEILDGIVLLYTIAAHSQLGKVRHYICIMSIIRMKP